MPRAKKSPERLRAEAIATATLGHRRYLNGLDGNMYWSDLPEWDDRDDPDGGPFYKTTGAAIGSILKAAGFLVDPDTGEWLVHLID
jgi:hypothetical protein